MQGALAKERRENKMIERQQADNEVDTSKGRNWADPMPKNAPALASDSQSGGPGKVRLSICVSLFHTSFFYRWEDPQAIFLNGRDISLEEARVAMVS